MRSMSIVFEDWKIKFSIKNNDRISSGLRLIVMIFACLQLSGSLFCSN